MAYQSLYLSIFLSFQQFFHLISSAPMSPTVFIFCKDDEDNQVSYCKHKQGSENIFCLVFLFFPFPFSNSKVVNMETFVNDFPGTTWPRIFKFGTYIKFDRLYSVLKNQPHMAYQSLYLSIFFFPTIFPSYQLSIYKWYCLQTLYTQ